MGRPKGSNDIIKRKTRVIWTNTEEQFLKNNLDLSIKELAVKLHKSEDGINSKLRQLRLMRLNIFAYIDYMHLDTEKFAISGVYGIRNKISDRIYIGSSSNIKNRLKEHICALENKRHFNKDLQKDWSKNNFELIILYVCNSEDILKFEQRLINSWPNTYNKATISKKYWLNKTKKEWIVSRIKKGLPNECWEWQGKLNKSGYGVCTFDKKEFLIHRAILYIAGRDIDGQVVCHTCHNKKCCNPAHLECGTSKTNAIHTAERRREILKSQIEQLWKTTDLGLFAISKQLRCCYNTAKDILINDLQLKYIRKVRGKAKTATVKKQKQQYLAYNTSKTIDAWLLDNRCVVKKARIIQRLKNGWEFEKAISTPLIFGGDVLLTAFNETKNIETWVLDSRCKYDIVTLLTRLSYLKLPHQEAISGN